MTKPARKDLTFSELESLFSALRYERRYFKALSDKGYSEKAQRNKR
jgi:hypothetical protein